MGKINIAEKISGLHSMRMYQLLGFLYSLYCHIMSNIAVIDVMAGRIKYTKIEIAGKMITLPLFAPHALFANL